jgi:hypothetical protein
LKNELEKCRERERDTKFEEGAPEGNVEDIVNYYSSMIGNKEQRIAHLQYELIKSKEAILNLQNEVENRNGIEIEDNEHMNDVGLCNEELIKITEQAEEFQTPTLQTEQNLPQLQNQRESLYFQSFVFLNSIIIIGGMKI